MPPTRASSKIAAKFIFLAATFAGVGTPKPESPGLENGVGPGVWTRDCSTVKSAGQEGEAKGENQRDKRRKRKGQGREQ